MYYEWINLVNYYNLEGSTLMARTKALPLTTWDLLYLLYRVWIQIAGNVLCQ